MNRKKTISDSFNSLEYSQVLEYYFELAIREIEIKGSALRKAVENRMTCRKFYELLESDEKKQYAYRRACSYRMELMAEDILTISDTSKDDIYIDEYGEARISQEAIQRSKLRVDSRKWLLSKMNPKKYGDKVDITTDGEKIQQPTTIIQWGDNKIVL